MNKARALIGTWLLIDFFGEARRAGKGHASSLTTTIFTQSFLAFVFAALLYPDTPPVPFAAANLSLSSLLLAIGALGDDSRPERRAADAHLLRGSPVGAWTVAIARAGHAAFSLVLITIGMALPPAILLAFLTGDALRAVLYVLGACLCSALAVGTLGVFARATTMWLGASGTALLMGTLKAVALGGGIVLFALALPRLQGTSDGMPFGRAGTSLLPPYQVARWLWQPTSEAWRMLVLLGSGASLLFAAMALGGAADHSRVARRGRRPLLRLLGSITPAGPARAIAEFVAIGMWRSPGFRARVLPLLGVPTAMVFLAIRGSTAGDDFVLSCVVMQLPAIYLPFLVMFLPRADQPGTGWVFAQAPRLSLAIVHDATWRALVTHVLAPIFFVVAVVALALGNRGLPLLSVAVFAWGLAVFAARAATRPLRAVPFTESKEGENSPELGGMFSSALVLGALGGAFGLALPSWLRWPVAGAVAATAALLLWRTGRIRESSGQRSDAALPAVGDAADGAPEGGPVPQPDAPSEDPASQSTRQPPTLRRELRAIAVLYLFLCVLPLMVGTIFAA